MFGSCSVSSSFHAAATASKPPHAAADCVADNKECTTDIRMNHHFVYNNIHNATLAI